ncbi:MAG: hypothetical protein A3H42_01780 [Deltaproteobacteria bacterium RIFCSPLOWO2_02_FULL_46_8]|nr:MAG: hypothetical protein A3H42_01780 [Deltaproteobacteria bacterium RIFCSPLOWO2_02_FULL_46_8]
MAHIEIILSYRKRAVDDIKAAEEMFASRFYLAAISRAYYAAFYAVTAALLAKDVKVQKHKQLGIEFRRHFIKTGTLSKKYSEILEELFQARQNADYDAIPEITETRVRELIEEAKDFVQAVSSL